MKRIKASASRVIGCGCGIGSWKVSITTKKVIELTKRPVYRVLELVVLCLISAAIQGEGPG